MTQIENLLLYCQFKYFNDTNQTDDPLYAKVCAELGLTLDGHPSELAPYYSLGFTHFARNYDGTLFAYDHCPIMRDRRFMPDYRVYISATDTEIDAAYAQHIHPGCVYDYYRNVTHRFYRR